MTLVELMVSVAILSIMLLLCNMLLVRARRTMQVAESSIAVNGDVRAVSDFFRRDVARMSKEGFLYVVLPYSCSADMVRLQALLDKKDSQSGYLDATDTTEYNNLTKP